MPAPLFSEQDRNAIESALALATGERLRAADFQGAGVQISPQRAADPALPLSLEAYERCALERALAECRGDAARAAVHLGIGRSTFYRKVARHGIPVPRRAHGSLAAGGTDTATTSGR